MSKKTKHPKILALSGSLRRGSYNKAIIKAIAKFHPNVEIYESLHFLPYFNPDLDLHTLECDNSPKEVVEWREKVRQADVLLMATPEYAHQIPGVLKNALDWLVSSDAIVSKPCVVLSSSTSAMGADKAHAQLSALLRVISQNVLDKSSLRISRVNKKIDQNGTIIDESLKDALLSLSQLLSRYNNNKNKVPIC